MPEVVRKNLDVHDADKVYQFRPEFEYGSE